MSEIQRSERALSRISSKDYQNSLAKVGPKEAVNGVRLVDIKDRDSKLMLLSGALGALVKRFHFKKEMSNSEVVDLAIQIDRTYPTATIEDIVLCFKMAVSGEFGDNSKVFRLDASMVFEWLKIYFERRDVWEEEIRTREKRSSDGVFERQIATVNGEPKTMADLIRESEAVAVKINLKEKRKNLEAYSQLIRETQATINESKSKRK